MSSDDLLSKEHKERQRVTKACDNCRKKKIKCEIKGDTCASCELLQIPCLYLDPTKKRGPPKGAGRYINAIEDRLHRMEAIVGGLVREDDPLFRSNEELRALLAGPLPKSRGSRDSYHEKQQAANAVDQQKQPYLQHPNHSDPEHQHHPPPLHDYRPVSVMQVSQQQQFPIQYAMHQQPFAQHPGRITDMPLGQSPGPLSEGTQQTMDTARTGSFPRDLMRENSLQSFNSPSPVLSSDHSVADLVDSPTTESVPRTGVKTPPIEDVSDLEDDLGHLTLDQSGRERYVGKSSPMFYGERYYAHGQYTSAREEEAEKLGMRKLPDNFDLPSPDVMTHLFDLHFAYVHPFLPVFVWSKFVKKLQDRDYTPSFLFLLNSIFALASRYSDDVSFRTDPSKPETVGVRFANKARELLDSLYDSPDLYCVGALCLLAFQQMGTGNGYRAWMYVGIAIRMAQHLGLNRSCLRLNPHMPLLDREERNRIWWTCFTADRIFSASFGRPQGITEHDVDAVYPEGIDEENIPLEYRLEGATATLARPSPQSEKNFVYMVMLMRILGRVMVSLYSPLSMASSKSTASMTNPAPLEQLDKELTDWLLTLPPHLHFRSVQQEPGTFVCSLHMTFYAVLILLHRPYSHRSPHSTPNDPSISLSICTSAANNTIEMASNMMRAIDEKRGVPRLKCLLHNSVFNLFTAGLVHITNCTSTDPILAASAKLRTIETLKCMAIVEDVWITGKWCANNIKQLLKSRNIELPYSSEVYRSLSLGSVEELKKKMETGSPQADVAIAASIPKEQSFAYDIDQIMGYYQGTGTRHTEPQGRNSRHFSPTPYFSPIANHHHHHHTQTPMKPHPGLTQGHAQLPRRPRPGKNTSPSPSAGSVSSIPSSISGPTTTSGFFPSLQDVGITTGTSPTLSTSSVSSTTLNANALTDPFAAPGSATVAGADSTQQQQSQQQQSQPSIESVQQQQQQQQQPLNMYQNPFSSSLWGLPTSMDTSEWMTYMQNSGDTTQENAMELSIDDQTNVSSSLTTSTTTKSEPSMFGPLTEINAGLLDQNNISTVINNSINNSTSSSRTHPLSQSMSRSDFFARSIGPSEIIPTSSGPGVSTVTSIPVSMSSIPVMEVSSMSPMTKGFTAVSQEPVSSALILGGQAQGQPVIGSMLTHQPSEFFFLGGAVGMGMPQPQERQPQEHHQQ